MWLNDLHLYCHLVVKPSISVWMNADDIGFWTAKNISQWALLQQLFVGVMNSVCDKCTENLSQFKGVWDADWQRTFLLCFMMKTHFSVMLDIFSQLWPQIKAGSQTRGHVRLTSHSQTCWGTVCLLSDSQTLVHTDALIRTQWQQQRCHTCADRTSVFIW